MKRELVLIALSALFVFWAGSRIFSQEDGAAEEVAAQTEMIEGARSDTETVHSERGVLISKLKESGKTGLALLLVSIIGFSFAFERLFKLRRSSIVPLGLAAESNKLWEAGKFDELKEKTRKNPSTLARIITLLVDHRDGSHADVSNLAGDVASREMRVHLQKAYPLAVVATISPLLGLFGTVYGMIGAFESVALAGKMGDPSIMAGDIAYALITTALGLVIAVPALACYHFFRIRTNILGFALEEQLNHLVIRWFPIGDKKKS